MKDPVSDTVAPDFDVIATEIAQRFGSCPSFFHISRLSPPIVHSVWQQTKFGYLDNPIPAMFKERLFTYLSRFCAVPYCVARHAALLINNRPAGSDSSGDAMSAKIVVEMLQRPAPSSSQIDAHLQTLAGTTDPINQWPQQGSTLEQSLFDCSVSVFLRDESSPRCQIEMRRVLGPVWYDWLLTFVAFVRFAHFWAESHAELEIETDIQQLLLEQSELSRWLEGYRERVQAELRNRIQHEHHQLQQSFDSIHQLHVALKSQFDQKSQELMQEQAELHQAEQLLRIQERVIKTTSSGILITDALGSDNPIIFCNPASVAITGFSTQEMIGRNCRFLQRDDRQQPALDDLRRAIHDGSDCRVVLRNYRKDGTMFWNELTISPIRDDAGQVTHFAAIINDITAIKKADEALRQNEERLSMALLVTNDAIWDLDLIAGTVWRNEAYHAQFGCPDQTVSTRDWWAQRIHNHDRQRVVSSLDLFASGSGDTDRWSVDYRLLRADGSYAFVTDRAIRARDANGKPVRLLGAIIDQTERRALEKQILEIAAAEHRRIGNDLHDGIGQELTGMSMIANSLVLALSRKKLAEAEIAKKLEVGLRQALGQVRVLARGMNPVDIDAHGLMSALTELCRHLNEISGIEAQFQYQETILLRDNQAATQLFRITQEAVTNSIKHGKAESIIITLSYDGDGALLSVVDDGVGISDKKVVDAGMGLRIMRYRAGVIGGQLHIAKLGKRGTKISCTLPSEVLDRQDQGNHDG